MQAAAAAKAVDRFVFMLSSLGWLCWAPRADGRDF
jgi:hypothetical protein